MPPLNFGYFRDRSEEDLFFGKLEHLSDQEILDLTKLYLQDVIRYLFGDLPNNMRIILPVKNLSHIDRLFSSDDLKYYFAGKYFVIESQDRRCITDFIEYFKSLFNSRIPLSHLHYSTPSIGNSTDRFRFTENTNNIHDKLPFPKYILWAFENTNRLNVSETVLNEWIKRDIKRLSEIEIVDINDEIFSFNVIIESRPFSEIDWF